MWQDQLFSACTARPRPGLPLRFSRSGWTPQGAKGPKAPRFHRADPGVVSAPLGAGWLFVPQRAGARTAQGAAPFSSSGHLLFPPVPEQPQRGQEREDGGCEPLQGAQPLRTAWARTERGARRPLWWDFCPISRLVSHVLKSNLFSQHCLTVLKY